MSDKKEKPQTAFDVENMFCKKIDIHTHIMPTRLSVEDRIWANELLGVSKCVLLTSAAERSSAIGGEPFTGDDAYEACLSYPDIQLSLLLMLDLHAAGRRIDRRRTSEDRPGCREIHRGSI